MRIGRNLNLDPDHSIPQLLDSAQALADARAEVVADLAMPAGDENVHCNLLVDRARLIELGRNHKAPGSSRDSGVRPWRHDSNLLMQPEVYQGAGCGSPDGLATQL